MQKKKTPFANYKKKYYRKIYTEPKLNKFLLQTSSFYRLYVHYLYKFGKLPAKIQAQELTPEYFKEKRKNNMIFEELNFLARHRFQSIKEVKDYRTNLEDQLPILKGKRENLWRKYNKTTDNTAKNIIKYEINKLTEKINILTTQKNACNRIIGRYPIIKEEYQKEIHNNKKQKN